MDSADQKQSDTAMLQTKQLANKNFKRGASQGTSIKKKSAQKTVSIAKTGRKSAVNAADNSSNASSKK